MTVDREQVRRDAGLPMTKIALIANGLRQGRGAGLAKMWIPINDCEAVAVALDERNALLAELEQAELERDEWKAKYESRAEKFPTDAEFYGR